MKSPGLFSSLSFRHLPSCTHFSEIALYPSDGKASLFAMLSCHFLKTELQLSDLSLSKLLLTGIGFLYCNMENYLLGSCWHYKSGAQPCKGAPLWWEWKRCLKRHPWNQTTRPFPCSSQSSLLMLAVLLYASSCLSDRHIEWKLRDPYSVAIIF